MPESAEENNLTSVSIRAIDIAKEDDESSPEYSPNGRYRKLNTVLGRGSFKNVYKAIDEEEGKEVAWNSLLIKDYETAQEERVTYLEEIRLLKSISHPNIIELYDFWFTDNNFVFITELMTSGTLRDYVRNVKDMNIKIIRKWSRQILEGIFYLHNLNPMIIHRDIKCENIFVNGATGVVKIGDLGIAKKKDIKRYTMVGTPEFMAREIFEGEGYSEKVDVYAFGMCLLEMATGKSPYSELKNTAQVFRNVLKGILPEGVQQVKDQCLKSLILGCLDQENQRPCVTECLSHHFFQQDVSCDGRCFRDEEIPASTLKDIEIVMRYGPSNIIRCQVYFNSDPKYVTFKYNPDFDTPDGVSQEMVDQGLIDIEDRRDVADLISKALGDLHGEFNSRTANIVSIVPRSSERSMLQATSSTSNPTRFTNTEKQCTMRLDGVVAERCVDAGKVVPDTTGSHHAGRLAVQGYVQTATVCPDQSCSNLVHSSTEVMERSPVDKGGGQGARTSETMEAPKVSFPDTAPIEELVMEAASLTKRCNEISKEWIEIFKQADIDTVGELRVLTEEDWNTLSLTVFGARAIKNMLFGKSPQPLPEKELVHNNNIKEYGDDVTVHELLGKLLIYKKEAIKRCEERLKVQDIRTLGELRSLHENDWNKLGLSVLAHRVLKNTITRRGRSLYYGVVLH